MAFYSPEFAIFFGVLLVTLCLPLDGRAKQIVIIVASFVFYASFGLGSALLLAAVAVGSFAAARYIETRRSAPARRWAFVAAIGSQIGALAYFKYKCFVLDGFRVLTGMQAVAPAAGDIFLSVGLSFYLFKSMGYTIDVYRRDLAPLGFWQYLLFLTYFPELIAGPIERAGAFKEQLTQRLGPTLSRIGDGASRFLVGLTKKVLVADRMALIAAPIFAAPDAYSGVSIWMGVIAYTIQIYCDFSGYTDMAIGISRVIGYEIPANFALPYSSRDIGEFWRRWHITLGAWLRDYLYIPLGGNRNGLVSSCRNLIVTMAIGGLWHGASLKFVVWGLMHGIALAVHRVWRRWFAMPAVVAIPLTLVFVMLAWVPFRAADLSTTAEMWVRMFGVAGGGVRWVPVLVVPFAAFVAAEHILGGALGASQRVAIVRNVLSKFGARVCLHPVAGSHVRFSLSTPAGAYIVALWILVIYFFSPVGNSAFIYAQF